MDISKIPAGNNPPHEVNVIIEIARNSEPVKYEIDKASGALFVDRFRHSSMHYPLDYGFVPHTLTDDGDPVDSMVLTRARIIPGAVVMCRPVGVLLMEDEAGKDEKVTGVPVAVTHPYYDHIEKLSLRIVCMDVRWRLRGKPGVRRSPVQAAGTIAGSCRDIWSRRLGSAAGNPSTGHVGC